MEREVFSPQPGGGSLELDLGVLNLRELDLSSVRNLIRKRGGVLIGLGLVLVLGLASCGSGENGHASATPITPDNGSALTATADYQAERERILAPLLTPQSLYRPLCTTIQPGEGIFSALRREAKGELPVCLDGTHSCQMVTINGSRGGENFTTTVSFEDLLREILVVWPGDIVCLKTP
ncbi:MAG: hypothetical protein NC935_07920 [Candidatus Omnitrophica bacterium]|nr:hypothetical protein [Candidatus Omnitrophota bacterium]